VTHEDAEELWRQDVRWTLLAFRLGDQLRDIEAKLVAMQSRLWARKPDVARPRPAVEYSEVQLRTLETLERIRRIGTHLSRFNAACRSCLRYYDDRSPFFLR